MSGPVVLGNIDLSKRPVVLNADGSYSTVLSFSAQDDDGLEVLLPMVAPNGTMFPSQAAAWDYYKQTGQNLGKFSNPDDADAYAESLHNTQAKMYDKKAAVARALMNGGVRK